ncbi:hypothetical protein ACIPW9_36365 [Streptomyces sp. NPDC090052]|uniref:hypothetical protein n=1 Tax=Streptomyces sp. NPDC090052 TaxID=3365931 RepID=UPI00380E53E6
MDYLTAIGVTIAALNAAVVAFLYAAAWNRDRIARHQDTALTRELATVTVQSERTAA